MSHVTFRIDSTQRVQPISRYIYGINGNESASRPRNLALFRTGGNRATAYNWENNASNAGTDWYNQNDNIYTTSTSPGAGMTRSVDLARATDAGTLVTVPIVGYVAADVNGGGDVNQTPNYLATRFRVSVPRKGSAFTTTPNANDAYVYQDEWVNFLIQRYPQSQTDPLRPIFYSLDNEPDLWFHTHPRIRGDATGSSGTPVTYAELLQRNRDYASAIKSVAPQGLVFGPVNYGWAGMVNLQNAPDAQGRDFLDFYLQEMSRAGTHAGQRLLDVLDIHWYPESLGNDANGTPRRTTENNNAPGVVAARLASPRSLWDASYTETSWITQYSTQGPIRLLPRLQGKIDSHYPGTRLAITEYNYGGTNHISGGIAQADVLGIFGRDGVFAAAAWMLTNDNGYLFGGFDMFRNFDGANGSFGDTSVSSTTSDNGVNTSIYGSVDAGNPNRMVLVAINKTATPMTSGIQVSHPVRFTRAAVYTLTSAGNAPQARTPITLTQTNAFQYTMPAYSVSTLVLTPN